MSGASANLRRHVQQLVEVHRDAALSDHQLLQRFAAQREEAAFALLVRRHGPMVLSLCRRVLGHEQDAEDAFQAAFLILARKAGAIRQTDVGGFLYRVAYHLAVRARGRAAKREQRVGAASRAAPGPARLAGPTSPDPLTDVTWREVRQLVDEELQRLPETLRSALVLCYLEDKTQEQAAARLGWSKSTLRRRLDRGRELLRRHLLARGLSPAAPLTATLFAEGAAPAMAPALADATVRSAVQGEPLAPAVAALVEGGALLPTGKTKIALAILLAVSLLGGATACGFVLSRQRSAQPPAATAAPPKREATKKVEIQGRVLDPEGKPKAGAKLLLLGKDKSTELGVSAADGRFTVAVPKDAKGHYLIAQAEGTGIDFLDLPQGEPKKPVELRLVNDRAIRGEVVNTEGKPVAGVRVAVDNLGVYPNNSLDSFLAIWKKQQRVTSGLPNGVKHIWEGAGTLLAATTDAEGRFTLPHVGEERLVSLRLSEGGIADAEIWVVNRRGFDPKSYNEAVLNNSGRKAIDVFGNRWRLHGPDLSVVAEAGKTIGGVVKDIDTSKGRPGVEVILSKDGNGHLLTGPLMKVRTDKQAAMRSAAPARANRTCLK
ncbi:MAG TPA: sigma-70 family RNA polymerase sigma factor [Gemmataceae bacterium]|jgi:RNA polymerase sigma factor (sigma-70 family)